MFDSVVTAGLFNDVLVTIPGSLLTCTGQHLVNGNYGPSLDICPALLFYGFVTCR